VIETLGILGFAISTLLAAIKIWETFFRKAHFEADIDWAHSDTGPVLEIAIANTGWKKDSIRAIHFRTKFPDATDPHRREWLEWEIEGPTWGNLPLVLDVDEVTPRQRLPLAQVPYSRLVRELVGGRAQLLILNARGRKTFVSIEAPSEGPPPPPSETLR
jgi:hypothetical protein